MKVSFKYLTQTVLLILPLSLALAQQPTVQERVVALKASLAASQAILKQYEWVETTIVSLKGDEKSRKQERCYYGADGKVQKVLLSQTAPPPKKRGPFRRKIAEAKQEELTDYMKEAVALVKLYMPPQPTLIQRAKDAGKVSLSPQPGQQARLVFADYLKSRDSLTLAVDLASNRPVAAKVFTYLDSQKEPVTLDVRFGTLNNNATYAATTVLDAKGKDLRVTVENAGYRPM
ncbi:MAG: hypothetical protein JXQ71_08515 [Verrucomicrobia bacterium]|nr:hypothetical protein [Verrucomicrobiota bacterium]